MSRTTSITSLTFLCFFLRLNCGINTTNNIIGRSIDITKSLSTMTKISIMTKRSRIWIHLSSIFNRRRVVIFLVYKGFSRAKRFNVELFRSRMVQLLPLLYLVLFFQVGSCNRVRTIIPRRESSFILQCQCKLRMERSFFPRGVFSGLLIRQLRISILVRGSVISAWNKRCFLFMSIRAIIRLPNSFPISFLCRFANELCNFFVTFHYSKDRYFVINRPSFMGLLRVKEMS